MHYNKKYYLDNDTTYLDKNDTHNIAYFLGFYYSKVALYTNASASFV